MPNDPAPPAARRTVTSETIEVLHNRVSVRKYSDKPVDDAMIDEVRDDLGKILFILDEREHFLAGTVNVDAVFTFHGAESITSCSFAVAALRSLALRPQVRQRKRRLVGGPR